MDAAYAILTSGEPPIGSGLKTAVSGHEVFEISPVQNLTNVVRLPLAHHDLQGVAERDHPALAAQRGHLSDVVDIHDGIAVNPLELRHRQALPDRPQTLRGQETMLRGHNPYQL